MSSPFQQLLAEFEEIDRADFRHVAVVLLAMAIGMLVGVWASRRRELDHTRGSPALVRGNTLWYGLTFPLVTCLLLVLFRLTATARQTVCYKSWPCRCLRR